MKGDIDMSVTTSETAEVITDSDKDVVDWINVEKEVELIREEKEYIIPLMLKKKLNLINVEN